MLRTMISPPPDTNTKKREPQLAIIMKKKDYLLITRIYKLISYYFLTKNCFTKGF